MTAALAFVVASAFAQAPPTTPVLGRISFPNSGAPAAQAPFVRGVLLLHSFEYDDAIAAFREAERIDPELRAGLLGRGAQLQPAALVPRGGRQGQSRSRASRAVAGRAAGESADGAGEGLSRRRRAPLRRRYEGSTRPGLFRSHGDAVERKSGGRRSGGLLRVVAPGDIPSGQRNTAISLKAGGIATAILKRNPEHPGAAHYALHAYDDGEHAAMGLDAARIYARIAPASSHAQHMPSHAFLPLGLWDEASKSDEAAWQTSVDLARRKGLSSAQHDFHALGWLHYEYLQQGRFDKAQSLVPLVETALANAPNPAPEPREPPRTVPNHANHVESEIGRGNGPLSLLSERASMRARFVVESGRWELMKGQPSFDNVDELFALGLASVKLGDRGRAEAALEQLQGARGAAPDADNKRLAEIMYRQIGGLYQMMRGEKAEGLAALESASRLESQMPRPIARPYPVKPAGELYAETLLAAGDAAGAVREFQAALQRTPRRAASLIGLARAAAAAKQPALASRSAREFLTMWSRADQNRPEIAEAKQLAR